MGGRNATCLVKGYVIQNLLIRMPNVEYFSMLSYKDTASLHYHSFLENSKSPLVLQTAIWQSEKLSCCSRQYWTNESQSSGKEDEVIMKRLSICQVRANKLHCAEDQVWPFFTKLMS